MKIRKTERTKPMLTVGSLFSGIGGLELGLERAGMKTIWQVERDPFALAILEKHWPQAQRFTDIRGLDPAVLARPDVLCGGFPCQPHSLAGKRRASADERDLWGEFARVIRGTRPRWVLAENVPGLLTSEGGAYFGRVLADLAALGFDAEWTVRGARHVGAPHRRDRVFLLAYPKGLRWPEGRSEPARQQGRPDAAERGGEVPGSCASANNDGREGLPERYPQAAGRHEEQQQRRDADGLRDGGPGARHGAHRVPRGGEWWAVEPRVGRVAHGVPARVDRLRALGNAVVPQVAEEIGRLIVAATHG